MASRRDKRKEQKKTDRRKRLVKERNERSNGSRFRFVLECKMESGKPWKPVKGFKDMAGVQRHIDETAAIRKRGDTDIIAGRILDLDNFNRVIATVAPYSSETHSMRDAVDLDVKKIEIPEK